MKRFKIHLILFTGLMFLICSFNLRSQVIEYGTDCGMDEGASENLASPYEFGGAYKPEKTHSYPLTDNNSVFRILMVFVQFQNDTIDTGNSNWPSGQPPSYMNNLLAPEKSISGGSSWWNNYNESNQIISDYWMEVSRGNLHVTGKCYHIELEHPWYWYRDNGGAARINSEIYDRLDTIQDINWTTYDNWTYKDGTYKYEKDKKIDMMYVVQRTWRADLDWNAGSIAGLFNSLQGQKHVVSSGDTIVAGFDFFGSGCHFTPGQGGGNPYGPQHLSKFMTVQAHELGHYFYGWGGNWHANYGIMMGQGRAFGEEARMSPWESIKLGWLTPITVNYNFINNSIGDFSSRHSGTQGQVLQVPISGDDEFFLIALRNKVSPYDRVMMGDTAHDDPFRNINPAYGKGVYVYHNNSGYTFSPSIDMECADGLYNWTSDGRFYPDWVNPGGGAQTLPIYVRTSVSYNNDNSSGSASNADEKDIVIGGEPGVWGSRGKLHAAPGGDGMDRILTNDNYIWTSRALKGDRWDAWNPGYNEIFSPYSSPSTNTWSNGYSGIFVWLQSIDENTAEFEIYRAKEEGGETMLSDILEATPPSRPMGLKIVVQETLDSEICHPKLVWKHNREPDMERENPIGINPLKKYKIYRTTTASLNFVPQDSQFYPENHYSLIATVTPEDDGGNDPFYVDENINLAECLGQISISHIFYPVRYRVQAVDYYEDHSVLSDFAATVGVREGSPPEEEDNVSMDPDKPQEFQLHSNFPNPFNPVTNIRFDVPKNIFVSIKIYDIAGREILTLVNEFKQAGSYITSFDASKLSSGAYFYRIEAGNFKAVRKMILLK